jgi:uncharacterized protein YjbI with pentapeptide repeats
MKSEFPPIILMFLFLTATAAFGAAWEGTDDFSTGISAGNWTTYQNYKGSMTVSGTNGHASFTVPISTTSQQQAIIIWKGTPPASNDWTAVCFGHNSADYLASGASAPFQLKFEVGNTANIYTSSYDDYYIMMNVGDYDPAGPFPAGEFQTRNTISGVGHDRQLVQATNNDFGLRLVHRGGIGGVIEAWYDATGTGSAWTLLDTLSMTNFSPSMVSTSTFTIFIASQTSYGPVTEGQIYADNFFLGNPPTIINQPASSINKAGTSATFSVLAGGTAPLSYQWRLNNTNLSGATLTNYYIASVQATNAGNYTVVITNVAGSVTSSVAALTVIFPPAITNQPVSITNVAGTTANFSVYAGGTLPLSYQWRFNNTNLAGATLTNYSIASVQGTNAGNYTVVITNIAGSITSSVAALTVVFPPTITNEPVSVTNVAGTTISFSVLAGGTSPLKYQWCFNSTNLLVNATNSALSITNVQATDVGNYSVVITNTVGSITSSVASLTVLFKPSITNQPVSVTNVAGTSTSFSVLAGGTAPLSYQWRFNNTNLTGATLASYTIASVQGTNAGNYTVVITNIVGSITSSVASMTVIFPPVITNQFASQTVLRGSNATFTVGATGTLPLAYQWRTNGIPYSGRITNWLTITNFQSTNEGRYDVFITNIAGSITSASAMLYFLPSNNASRLTSPAFVSNQFTLLLLGKATTNLIIQTSTNLITWTPLITNSSSSGVINFTDTNIVGDKRFYRARTP